VRAVLKITQVFRRGNKGTLKLEGEILEPWVRTVREVCTAHAHPSERLCLDLADVTYVDSAGAQLLRDLLGEGIELAPCSSFLTELLQQDE
jgi:anti-anti-sigma regulatory factor